MSFFDDLARSLERNRITRRQALWLLGAGAAAGLSGCATSPVTGETILVGMSEAQEKQTDAQVAPRQFSQDLGAIQDEAVNRYVAGIGQRMGALTHRPQMPYSYRVLNANYVNAYTFPGGAMGVTRGILADLDDEAQLAALLGHELGHVNARHAAQRQGQNLVAQAALAGLNVAAQSSDWGGLMSMGGQIGASALLAGYSREHEREADALGQEYLVKAGYPATGMVRLHQLLVQHVHALGPLRQARAEPLVGGPVAGLVAASGECHVAKGGSPGPVGQIGLHPLGGVAHQAHRGGLAGGARGARAEGEPVFRRGDFMRRHVEEPSHHAVARSRRECPPGPRYGIASWTTQIPR